MVAFLELKRFIVFLAHDLHAARQSVLDRQHRHDHYVVGVFDLATHLLHVGVQSVLVVQLLTQSVLIQLYQVFQGNRIAERVRLLRLLLF